MRRQCASERASEAFTVLRGRAQLASAREALAQKGAELKGARKAMRDADAALLKLEEQREELLDRLRREDQARRGPRAGSDSARGA